VVEATAWDEELTEGVVQAKNYAGKLAIRFTYSTNGQGICGIDMETGEEGEVAVYPTPDSLPRALSMSLRDATVLWRFRLRIRVVRIQPVTIRTLPSSRCWRLCLPDRIAFC